MPRPRKTPLVDSGADLLAAVTAEAPTDGGPAKPPKPARKAKAPAAKAKATQAKTAAPEAPAPAEADAAPKARAGKRPAAAKTVAVAEAASPDAALAVPAAKPAKAAKPKRKAAAEEPMLDLGMAEAAPKATAAAQAPVAAAPAAGTGAAPAEPVAAAEAPAKPKSEAPASAAVPAEPRYPRRQPVPEPPPRRPAPEPLERPAPRAAPLPPRPLSMAELAERQRQSRELARHPERDNAAGREAPPRPTPLSMQERAMRYRGPAEPETRTAPAEGPQAAPTSAAVAAAPAERRSPDDGQARALEAARHKREAGAAGPSCAAPPWESAAVSGGATIALVTRNHAAILEERLKAWRAVLPEPDLRWAVLDLGSTDATAQKVEEFPGVRLIVRPGGLVEPAATLRAALKGLTGDAVVLIDVEAQPDSVVESLLRALKAGAAVAVAPRRHPDFAALSRAAWDQGGQPELHSLLPWGEVHGGLVRFGPLVGQSRPRSLVQRLCPDAQSSRWDLRRLLPTRVRNLLNRFGVLGGAA